MKMKTTIKFLAIFLLSYSLYGQEPEKFAGFTYGCNYTEFLKEVQKYNNMKPIIKITNLGNILYYYQGDTIFKNGNTKMIFSFKNDKLWCIKIHILDNKDKVTLDYIKNKLQLKPTDVKPTVHETCIIFHIINDSKIKYCIVYSQSEMIIYGVANYY